MYRLYPDTTPTHSASSCFPNHTFIWITETSLRRPVTSTISEATSLALLTDLSHEHHRRTRALCADVVATCRRNLFLCTVCCQKATAKLIDRRRRRCRISLRRSTISVANCTVRCQKATAKLIDRRRRRRTMSLPRSSAAQARLLLGCAYPHLLELHWIPNWHAICIELRMLYVPDGEAWA